MGFPAYEMKNHIVCWIKNWFYSNSTNGVAVVGISGGKDSSVVAALCVEALGKEKVIGVLMPNREQSDFEDALKVVEHLGIDYIISDIGDMYDGFMKNNLVFTTPNTSETYRLNISEQTKINLPPRLRMAVLYAIAQSCNGRVANTSNLSEKFVGYSTRWGDSVGDFSPLGNLTSDEVVAVGLECDLPEFLVKKTPSDGLCGKTDEENLGITYRDINSFIRTGKCGTVEAEELIKKKHEMSKFKNEPIPTFEPFDW